MGCKQGVCSQTVQNSSSSVFFLCSLGTGLWVASALKALIIQTLPTSLFSTTTNPIVLQGQKTFGNSQDRWLNQATHFRAVPHFCVIKPGFIGKLHYL